MKRSFINRFFGLDTPKTQTGIQRLAWVTFALCFPMSMFVGALFLIGTLTGCDDGGRRQRQMDGVTKVSCYRGNPSSEVLTVTDAVMVEETQKNAKYRITRKSGAVVEIDANCFVY